MGVTVQVRDLDDRVQQRLRDAADRQGLSLSAFLRQELTQLASRLDAQERFEALGQRTRLGISSDFFSGLATDDIVGMIREDRER